MKIMTWLTSVLALFASCLREIFDESAYQRFLREHRMTSSRDAYEKFCCERATTIARRPRCC
jgi:hypothetical protein